MAKKGRPEVDTEPVSVRLPREMLDALDEYRRVLPDIPSRPESIRRVLGGWIIERERLRESEIAK